MNIIVIEGERYIALAAAADWLIIAGRSMIESMYAEKG